jgi:hypothetical protein
MPPLPDFAVTFEVLQLAKQVRATAMAGQCETAWITWTSLAELDAGYATELRKGPVLATSGR